MPFLTPTLNEKWNKLYLKSTLMDAIYTDAAAIVTTMRNITDYGDGNGDYLPNEANLIGAMREGYNSVLQQGYDLMFWDYADIMKVLNLQFADNEDLFEQLSDYMHANSLWYKSRVIAYTKNDMAGDKIDIVYCDTDKRGYQFENIAPGKITFEVIADYNTGATRYGQEQLRIQPDRRGYDFIESIDRTNLGIDVITPIDSLSATLLTSKNQSFQGVAEASASFPVALSDDNMSPWELIQGEPGWTNATCIDTDGFHYDDINSKTTKRCLKVLRVNTGTNYNIFEIGIEPNFSLDPNVPYFFRVHAKNALATTNATLKLKIGTQSKSYTLTSGAGPYTWAAYDFHLDENCWYDVFRPTTATPVIVSIEITFDAASSLTDDIVYIDDIIFAEFDYVGNLPLFLVRGEIDPIREDDCDLTVSYTDSCLRQKVLAEHFDYYLPHATSGYITESGLIP